jgi:hypothetical protein
LLCARTPRNTDDSNINLEARALKVNSPAISMTQSGYVVHGEANRVRKRQAADGDSVT